MYTYFYKNNHRCFPRPCLSSTTWRKATFARPGSRSVYFSPLQGTFISERQIHHGSILHPTKHSQCLTKIYLCEFGLSKFKTAQRPCYHEIESLWFLVGAISKSSLVRIWLRFRIISTVEYSEKNIEVLLRTIMANNWMLARLQVLGSNLQNSEGASIV